MLVSGVVEVIVKDRFVSAGSLGDEWRGISMKEGHEWQPGGGQGGTSWGER